MSTPYLQSACGYLNQGGVIAYPTEAVWGLGCDPGNELAIQRLLSIKQRPVEKGLILVAANMAQIQGLLVGLSKKQLADLQSSWPGPITWLIPDNQQHYSHWVKGNHSKVAIRVSAHPLVQQLCEAFGRPLVSTSANFAGAPAIRDEAELKAAFGDTIDYIVPGELGDASSVSEIRDLVTGDILR